jgi:LysR family glycine cleavage system transcriptional activator
MQDRTPPLLGIRAFLAAARLGGIKPAAAALALTPGAVSHHVKNLEGFLGVTLFARRNNAVDLTAEGVALRDAAGPTFDALVRAAASVGRDADTVTVRAPASLALRWLVPHFAGLRRDHPRLVVRLESVLAPEAPVPGAADITLGYSRRGVPAGATALMTDRSVPIVAARHLRKGGRFTVDALTRLPLLAATEDDGDWRAYAALADLEFKRLRFAARFDMDEAALGACLAGQGVALAPAFMAERELAAGLLVAQEDAPSFVAGRYWMALAGPPRRARDDVAAWIVAAAAAVA